MSHGLEIRANGEASFAYDVEEGLPWHRLGTPVKGKQTVSDMLEIVGADFIAYAEPAMGNGHCGLVVSSEKVMVLADRPLGENGEMVSQELGVLGSGYTIVQYHEVADKALAVVGVAEGSAVIDTMGLINDGKRFFAYIDLGSVFLDPHGVNDEIRRGLLIHSSHDGSIAVTYAETDVRTVCANTLALGMARATKLFKAKHTTSVKDRMKEAEQVMGYQDEHSRLLIAEAEALLRVEFTEDKFEKVLTKAFPINGEITERKQKIQREQHDAIREIFANDRNSKEFGANGWTMYNAIGEYLDHHRRGNDTDLAVASITPGSWVETRKERVAAAIKN